MVKAYSHRWNLQVFVWWFLNGSKHPAGHVASPSMALQMKTKEFPPAVRARQLNSQPSYGPFQGIKKDNVSAVGVQM